MIDRLQIRNFKSLRDVDLKLGHVNLFIGANSSGKSNVFDALRVLHGLGQGLTVAETLDGQQHSAFSPPWAGVRGGAAHAQHVPTAACPVDVKSCSFAAEWREAVAESAARRDVKYEIEIDAAAGVVLAESLIAGAEQLVRASEAAPAEGDPRLKAEIRTGPAAEAVEVEFDGNRSVVAVLSHALSLMLRLPPTDVQAILGARSRIANAQFLDPNPRVLRTYAAASSNRRMGPEGEDFAAVVNSIISQPETRSAYVEWLRDLSSASILDVEALKGASDDLMFAVKEAAGTFPAAVVSDGTLRFAALVAAFFQPSMPSLLALEDVENGLHPSRIRLLYLLLRDQSERAGTQVFATTHSPTLLTWLRSDEEFDHAFLCRRDKESGETKVLPLSSLPGFVELARNGQAGDLMVEGWMEDIS